MNNVALMKEGYAAFAKGNIDAVLAIWDPQIEWHECKGMPVVSAARRKVHRASGRPRRRHREDSGTHRRLRIEIEEVFGSGDRVVMSGHYVGTLKATGKRFKARSSTSGRSVTQGDEDDPGRRHAEIISPKG